MDVTLEIIDRDENGVAVCFEKSYKRTCGYKFCDFRGQSLNWYFNDWSRRFHPDGIRGDIDGVIDPGTLMFAGENMMQEVARDIDLTLNDDPIEAKLTIDRIRRNDLARLQAVITRLDEYLEAQDPNGAWEFLKGAPKKFTASIPNRVNQLHEYIELAIFFYIVGLCGHSIKWNY